MTNTKNTKKTIKEEGIIEGYEVGKLTIVVQAIKDSATGKPMKGVFCGLKVKKDKKEETINFVFALDSIPSFRKHVISMINQAVKLKAKGANDLKVVKKVKSK